MKHPIQIVCLSAVVILTSMASLAGTTNPPERPDADNKGCEKNVFHSRQSGVLSSQQQATIAKILSEYSPDRLTAEDARAINNAFRKAGIRRGPGQPEAIRAAGFDPEKIRALDPPPEPKAERKSNRND